METAIPQLWMALAGPLVALPKAGTKVVYFPQGHEEQVSALLKTNVQGVIASYPDLLPQLFCRLCEVKMHADQETEDVYALLKLQPLSQEEICYEPPTEMGFQATNFYLKTLTKSDIKTSWGCSVSREAAERLFPMLDATQHQDIILCDIRGDKWTFKHSRRGHRHVLSGDWRIFVKAKDLKAGDSVVFMSEKNKLLVGTRRSSNRESVVISNENNIHMEILKSALQDASRGRSFTLSYYPRACKSEFVIPLSKFWKTAFETRISAGVRFRMPFEGEGSMVCRYKGTVAQVNHADLVHWGSSYWRSLEVIWDASTSGERPPLVSLWEIEPSAIFPRGDDSNAIRYQTQEPGTAVAYNGGLSHHTSLPSTDHDQFQAISGVAATSQESLWDLGVLNSPRSDYAFLDSITAYAPNQFLPNAACSSIEDTIVASSDFVDNNTWMMTPYGSAFLQGSSTFLDDPDNILLNAGGNPRNQKFVKVFMGEYVGREIDINRFSHYDELREEVHGLFGIDGSGWDLVFCDIEGDLLLLGDQNWESFVADVQCIKILSPDELKRTGES